jgi:hypothetical protein
MNTSDIIQINLPVLRNEDSRYLYATPTQTGIQFYAYGEDRENGKTTLPITKDKITDYTSGAVLAEEISEGPSGNDKTHIKFMIIPASRLEEIKKNPKGIDLFELGKRIGGITEKYNKITPGKGFCGIVPDQIIGKNEKTPQKPGNENREYAKGELLINFFKANNKEIKVSSKRLIELQKLVKDLLDPKGYIKRDVFKTLSEDEKKILTPLAKDYAAQLAQQM